MEGIFSSNNATKKLLGFDYQKFLALEACLNSAENELVWIECHGDIAYNGITTEVKHHFDKGNLNDSHKDVWKTIHNLVNDHSSLTAFHKYELRTTSSISEKSIFHKWNEQSKDEKFDRLLTANITESIKKFYITIKSSDKALIKSILSKFYIYGSQPTIDEKLQQLKMHSALSFIDEVLKEAFIERMLGYISNQAINKLDNWHININEFRKEMTGFAKVFCSPEYPFPKTPKPKLNGSGKNTFNFIRKMEEIMLDDILINGAVIDYLRSEISNFKILEYHSSMSENLETYEDDIKNDLFILRLKHSSELSIAIDACDKSIFFSQQLYADSQTLQLKKVSGLQTIEGYFQKGRIHAIVDRNEFKWLLK